MKKTYIYLGFGILLVVLISVFLYFLPKEKKVEEPVDRVTTKISVEHSFSLGVHTYTGIIQVPTPCHEIFGEAIVKESYPEQVDIKLETRESGEVCIQVIAEKRFKVSFQASERPIVKAFLNGSPVLFIVTEIKN